MGGAAVIWHWACVCVWESERARPCYKRTGEGQWREIAYVLWVSAPVLSSVKPFNKEGGRGEGMKESGLWQNTDSPPPWLCPSLISCHPFFFLHTLTPSLHPLCLLISFPPFPVFSHPPPSPHPLLAIPPSFTLFPLQSLNTRSLARCEHAHVCLCMLDAHFIDRLRL